MGVARAVNAAPAVFLDRDGVLNEVVIRHDRPCSPESVDELVIVEDAAVHLAALKRAGYVLICVTNQPDVARGRQTRQRVEAINAVLRTQLPLDDLRVCWHDAGDACACRKPQPGMLLAAAADHGIDLTRSVMVGDRWIDIDAGRRAGCRAVLVGTGYGEPQGQAQPDAVVASLREASSWILRQAREEAPWARSTV